MRIILVKNYVSPVFGTLLKKAFLVCFPHVRDVVSINLLDCCSGRVYYSKSFGILSTKLKIKVSSAGKVTF